MIFSQIKDLDGVEIPGREHLLPRISVLMCGVLLPDLTLDKVLFFLPKKNKWTLG